MTNTRFLLVCALFACVATTAFAQIDARVGFTVMERNPRHGRIHFDTCGVRTGATDAVDSFEVEWPPLTPDNTFDAHWLTPDGAWLRTDLRTPPPGNRPPFMVEYVMEFAFSISTDTMVIAYDRLPALVDSVWLDDTLPASPAGAYFHRVITHSGGADSLLWWKPAGIDMTQIRFRVFYNRSATGIMDRQIVSAPEVLVVSPNPAHGHVAFFSTLAGTLSVRDMLGREVRRIEQPGNEAVNFSLEGLAAGTYAVVRHGQGPLTRALFVVH